jgi:hypothetical protein
MKTRWLSFALVAAGFAALAVPLMAPQAATAPAPRATAVGVPDPARQIEALVPLFRSGDVAALVQALVPPAHWEEARLAYELQRLEAASDSERARFGEQIERLHAPDAVDQLMAEIEPKLEQARPQAPGAVMMAFGAIHVAIASPESKLSDEQRAAIRNALPGVQRWAAGTDFLSSTTMREALGLLVDAARRTGITDLDQLKAMPLETAFDHAGAIFVAAKEAVRLYGLDLDAIVDTLRVELLAIDGDTARVRTTVTVFGAPLWADHELVLVEGRWYGRQAVLRFAGRRDLDVEG